MHWEVGGWSGQVGARRRGFSSIFFVSKCVRKVFDTKTDPQKWVPEPPSHPPPPPPAAGVGGWPQKGAFLPAGTSYWKGCCAGDPQRHRPRAAALSERHGGRGAVHRRCASLAPQSLESQTSQPKGGRGAQGSTSEGSLDPLVPMFREQRPQGDLQSERKAALVYAPPPKELV